MNSFLPMRRATMLVGLICLAVFGSRIASHWIDHWIDNDAAQRPPPVVRQNDLLPPAELIVGGQEPSQSENAQHGAAPMPINLTGRSGQPSAEQDSIDALTAKVDARLDQWDTEVLADAAITQLRRLERWIEKTPAADTGALASLLEDPFVCQALRPEPLIEVYRDALITVRRRNPTPQAAISENVGPDGFQHALRALLQPLGTGAGHVHFKLFRISKEPTHFTTTVRYEAERRGEEGSRQQTGVWNCQWSYPQDSPALPRLRSIDLDRYEEVDSTLRSLFADCTESAIGANENYLTQVIPGINEWRARMPSEFIGQFGHHGIAVGDVNGDGLDDLYVCDASGLPNRLYVQQSDGTAQEISSAAGVDFLDDSTGALLADLDNDGDQDLVVAIAPDIHLGENDGQGQFRLHAPIRIDTDSLSISASDPDADGDLDLYICGYNVRTRDPADRSLPFPLPYYDASNGGRNVLLRNEGGFHFVDGTRSAGLDDHNSRFSMAAAWEDFDNDGDQDLYVANDFGRNNLFRNDGSGRFTDIAATAGVEDHASGMSVSWADYDRDGRMDLYVGNMFSAAGNRITYQRKFSAGRTDRSVKHMRRMARGNTLFANISQSGSGQFRDVSESEAVEMGRWAWASQFVDLTNDGWPDLIVANGYVTNTADDDL